MKKETKMVVLVSWLMTLKTKDYVTFCVIAVFVLWLELEWNGRRERVNRI